MPKIKMGSRIMLIMAPSTWVHIERTVRPVAWSIRSAVNCRKIPMDTPRQMEV